MRSKWTPARLKEVEDAHPLVGIRIIYKRKVRRGGKKVRQIVQNGKKIKRWVRRGGRLVWKYGPAHANLLDAECLLPRPITIYGLYVNLHERYHFILRHFDPEDAPNQKLRDMYTGNGHLTEAEMEFQAEQAAIAAMERHGVPVTPKILFDARKYVQECMASDVRKGDGEPPRHIKRWAGRRR